MFQATTSAGLSQAETEQFTPLQLFLQLFRPIVNLWCKLDLKERATTNERKRKPVQKQGGKGATELLPQESHASAILISRHCLPQL